MTEPIKEPNEIKLHRDMQIMRVRKSLKAMKNAPTVKAAYPEHPSIRVGGSGRSKYKG